MKWLDLSIMVLALFVTTASAVDDVPGWQGVRWGMTQEEARAAVEADGLKFHPQAKYPKHPFVGALTIGGGAESLPHREPG